MAKYIIVIDYSILPYLTISVANNPFSLLAEIIYGLDFILVNSILYWMGKSLLNINSEKKYLSDALAVKNALIIPFLLFIIGLIIAF